MLNPFNGNVFSSNGSYSLNVEFHHLEYENFVEGAVVLFSHRKDFEGIIDDASFRPESHT